MKFQKDLVTKYKVDLEKRFLSLPYEDAGIIKTKEQTWFNVKSLQIISGMAKLYTITKNPKLVEKAKSLFFLALSKQHSDGYYDSEVYSEDHSKMRANVIFINIELFNAFELLEDYFSQKEKNSFFEAVSKSSIYIEKFLSPNKEANQTIAGLLFFLFCKKYDLSGKEQVEHYEEIVKSLQTEQGFWGEKSEAPAFDALYGSLSLAYLARCCDLDKSFIPLLQKGLEFITPFLKGGHLDLSFSKRWIPKTPQGHRFFVYALAKSNHPNEEYILQCLNSNDDKCSYYLLCALEIKERIILDKREVNIPQMRIKKRGPSTAIVCALPSRVSGGEITSLYNQGWVIQQPLIGKNALPTLCSQVRVKTPQGIVSSYLDNKALIGNQKVISNLRYEKIKNAHFPFGHYEVENTTSEIMLSREYHLDDSTLRVSGKLFFKNKPNHIEVIIPLLRGKIISNYQNIHEECESPYGTLTVNKLQIPISNKITSFEYSLHF